MISKEKKIIFLMIILLLLGGIFILPSMSHAADNPYAYTPMEPIPGFPDTGNDLVKYIQAIYGFGIWTVGIAAILMLTIGGFMYMVSAGNTSKVETAKGVIVDALTGLGIALAAYLILYVINPDLTKIKIEMKNLGISSTTTPTGTGSTKPATTTNPAVPPPPADSSGCSAIASAAQAMVDKKCLYSQARRNDGCAGNPGYTDCSKFAGDAYVKAGCRRPGNVSGDFLGIAESIGDSSTLKAGDVLAKSGHVVVCKNNGCSRVLHASTDKSTPNLKESNGSSYFSVAKVVRASRFCDSCKN